MTVCVSIYYVHRYLYDYVLSLASFPDPSQYVCPNRYDSSILLSFLSPSPAQISCTSLACLKSAPASPRQTSLRVQCAALFALPSSLHHMVYIYIYIYIYIYL